MTIATVIIGDGRIEYLRQAVASYTANVVNASDYRIMVNDTGDPDYASLLDAEFPEWTMVHHSERRGMAAAVRSGWSTALETGCDFLFHTEEDFTFNEVINALPMAHLLESQPHLAQLVLKRQPWSDVEIAAGGQIETAPHLYTERGNGIRWVEHETLFSFNPSLISANALRHAWHDLRDGLERGVTDGLLARGYKFAYWRGKADGPLCHHIGTQRSQGYRW